MIIGGRYECIRELGGGGMAVVFEARDTTTNHRLALKRPRAEDKPHHQRRNHELFAREYLTLAELRHPRIVQVYDYAVDGEGPYYTMELLDGGDLLSLVPVDYRRACMIARDVCSALSLLHSRRIVHRDVSPRNIRCTVDGLAKLIDFGAMTHMGPCKELVGTPVFCAPELVQMQALDGRADLYSLGATLYYALTRHHPYPARDFAALPSAWRMGVARPSELAGGIPEALDELILDLLQLAPDARPSNAAEVMARLSAIAGIPVEEQLLVSQAYLTTPVFVGRERQTARVNIKAMRVLRKRGAAVLVEGPRGCGRSRFLDTCLLSSKLSGVTVVRADAADAERDYAVVRSLLARLRQAAPELLRELLEPVLPFVGMVAPDLVPDQPSLAGQDLASVRPQLQKALHQLLLGVAERTPLLIAIDDLDAIDEPSLAVLGLLAQEVRRTPLLLIATAASDVASTRVNAFTLFERTASKLQLENLTASETRDLIGSIFGTTHLHQAIAARLHALSGGSPRDLMRLAQHLVDTGAARYESGTWTLSTVALPSSVVQVLSGRLQQLAPSALELAQALALSPAKSFSFDECCTLSARSLIEALSDIQQLTNADIVRSQEDRVVLADSAWAPLLRGGLDPARERTLHRRLAQCFEARGDEAFRRAQHLLRAGETERALDGFVENALASRALTNSSPEAFHQLLLSLPHDWLETYDEVLRLLRESDRPKRDEFAVLARLNGMFALRGVGLERMLELMARLKAASGLLDWEQADPSLDPAARLRLALGRAQSRYAETPERDRVIEPAVAIRELAEVVRTTMYIGALALDLRAALSVPSLEPLYLVAPALRVSDLVVRAAQARLAGRLDHARELYRETLAILAEPERTGLGPTHTEYTRLLVLNARGALEAAAGIRDCLEAADEIEKHATMQSNAYLIRMVYQLWQGNIREAQRCRKQFEITRVQNSAAQNFESVQLAWDLAAHVATEDLTNIDRSLEEIAPLAARYPAFRALQSFGRAEHQRIRGDARSAVAAIEEILTAYESGTHQNWSQFAAAHIRALYEAGRASEAAAQGRMHLAEAQRAELGPTARFWISLALIRPLAKEDATTAVAYADAALAHCEASGATGLNLGLAHEARAHVAIQQDDRAAYHRHLAACEQVFTKASNPALSAKLQKLRREGQKHGLVALAPLPDGSMRNVSPTAIKSRLDTCGGGVERAHVMLALLAQQCGAAAGHLFFVQHQAPTWIASLGGREPDETLHSLAREYVLAEVEAAGRTTGASQLTGHTHWTAMGDALFRPVLLSHSLESSHVITGCAVFVLAPDHPFVYPAELATHISRVAHEAGDATGLVISED